MKFRIPREKLQQFSERLTDDAWPAAMPADLEPEMRGQWLLRHYGSLETARAIEDLLEHEASCGGFAVAPTFLGFIEDYFRLAQYLAKLDVRHTIVDVGCCAGLQQVFFADFAAYVGIDRKLPASARPLSANARFVEGEFAELVDSGRFLIEPHMVGIANMSLLYGGSERAIERFKRFKRLVLV